MKKSIYCRLILKSILAERPLEINQITYELVDLAKKNKVLYILGLYDKRIQKFNEWLELNRRRQEQIRAIKEVVSIAKELGISILIFKTIKPFTYVPDDVDILVINNSDLQTLINVLIQRNRYFIRKKGTPEVTLRRVLNNTYVDLDIHTKLAAGPYKYIDKYTLWNRHSYIKINHIKIPIPSPEDELLITAAHSIMKEFTILISDVLHVLYIGNRNIIFKARKQAKEYGLSKSLSFLLLLAFETINALQSNHLLGKYNSSKLFQYPYKVPFRIIVNCYLESLKHRIEKEGIVPIKELFMTPSSKGLNALLRYIGL